MVNNILFGIGLALMGIGIAIIAYIYITRIRPKDNTSMTFLETNPAKERQKYQQVASDAQVELAKGRGQIISQQIMKPISQEANLDQTRGLLGKPGPYDGGIARASAMQRINNALNTNVGGKSYNLAPMTYDPPPIEETYSTKQYGGTIKSLIRKPEPAPVEMVAPSTSRKIEPPDF